MGLFTAEAAQEGSSAGSAQFPAKLLASMIAPTADSTLPLVKNVRVAAAGQITPQLFAALGVADQSVLITVGVPAPVTSDAGLRRLILLLCHCITYVTCDMTHHPSCIPACLQHLE